MNQSKLSARRPTRQEMHQPAITRDFPDELLDQLAMHCDVLKLQAGTRINRKGKQSSHQMFVLQGKVDLRDTYNDITQSVQAGTTRSHFPLIPEHMGSVECRCETTTLLLRIPVDKLKTVHAEHAIEESVEDKAAENDALEERIFNDFHQCLKAGQLNLPGMPDVAIRIARHMDDPDSTSDSIARIIQMDPSITARLIQIANSPVFGGRVQTETCRDAVTRLGRQTTRDLVTTFVLRGVFRSRSQLIKKRMHALWLHSTQVAALSHALAKRSRGFDPAQALLIGLVHDIGVIPILTNAHRYEGLLEKPDLLDKLIQRLRADFSAMTLRNWGFASEFVNAAQDAENWFRNKQPQADYTDILILAQMHAHVGTAQMTELPRIDETPAFRKLNLGGLSPRMSLQVLDEAKQEILEVQQMLS